MRLITFGTTQLHNHETSFNRRHYAEWVLKMNYARVLFARFHVQESQHLFQLNFWRVPSKLTGSPTRDRVFDRVRHRRLAGYSTQSVQPDTVAKRRFWERKSSTGNCYRIKIG